MSTSHTVSTTEAPYYYVPSPSLHPITASIAMLMIGGGAAFWINGFAPGKWVFWSGIAFFLFVLYRWFGESIRESEGGLYGKRVDVSYRWSMGWFIFSEVMFFGAFFGALFFSRWIATPWLGDFDHQLILWPGFVPSWPHNGPAGVVESFQTMGPFWLPTINTALLLLSGLTLTISHHALLADQRSKCSLWLGITILLGVAFICCQSYEYLHAYGDLNLKMSSGIYGSTFYLLTGFHGFHVCLGTLMLFIIWLRVNKGHFTSANHFGFEGVAWYWHFVDVVWLGLYLFVYWF